MGTVRPFRKADQYKDPDYPVNPDGFHGATSLEALYLRQVNERGVDEVSLGFSAAGREVLSENSVDPARYSFDIGHPVDPA
jgi:hypothetical protein